MKKFLVLPLALIFACALAGLYGVVHNQISYTVSPEYFHEFKFKQFRIEPNFQNRLGASLVGWHASWWMGLIIGIPVYFAALFVRGNRLAIKVFLKAAMIVVILTLLLGVIALVIGYFSISDTTLPSWMNGKNITNPVAFSRAGNMHNFSYLGGLVGLLSGLIFTIISAWKSRQREPITKIQ